MLMFHPLYKKCWNIKGLIIIIIIKACKGQEFFFREEGWGVWWGNDICLPSGFSVVIY